MVKSLQIVGLSLFLLFSTLFFIPKTNFYYLVEKELKKQNVVLSDESIVEGGFSLNIKDADIYFESIKSANIKELDISTLLFYNSINVKDIKLSGIAQSFVPIDIKSIDVTYTILNPLEVTIVANGVFGDAKANFDIVDKKLHLTLQPSKLMQQRYKKTLKYLVKNKNGVYSYDTIFN